MGTRLHIQTAVELSRHGKLVHHRKGPSQGLTVPGRYLWSTTEAQSLQICLNAIRLCVALHAAEVRWAARLASPIHPFHWFWPLCLQSCSWHVMMRAMRMLNRRTTPVVKRTWHPLLARSLDPQGMRCKHCCSWWINKRLLRQPWSAWLQLRTKLLWRASNS